MGNHRMRLPKPSLLGAQSHRSPTEETAEHMDLVIVFVLGVLAASLINLCVYRIRFVPLSHSPWNGLANSFCSFIGLETISTKPDPELLRELRRGKKGARKSKKEIQNQEVVPRTWLDAIPIYGWLRLAREEWYRGPRFWLRPMLFEIVFPIFLCWFYSWQVLDQAIVANPFGFPFAAGKTPFLDFFVAAALLFCFLAAASLIDWDEYEIPDQVIIPGTILGILWITITQTTPQAIVNGPPLAPQIKLDYVDVVTPNRWPDFLSQQSWYGLLIGVGCVWLWCFGLAPRVWRTSWKIKRSIFLFLRIILRGSLPKTLFVLGIAGTAAVWATFEFAGPSTWRALMTSLLGMVIGGLIIWTVRIVASWTIRVEAMGFGDVTLMAMIGAYLGWQSCVFVFFISPFFALVPALATAITRKTTEHPIPYGPFLCFGAATVVIFWRPIWEWGARLFEIAWFLPAVLAACVPMLAILLGLWRLIRYAFLRSQATAG